MTGIPNANSATIRGAFARLRKTEDQVIDDGLHRFLHDAMLQLEKEHAEFHASHPSFPNFHGEWDIETVAAGIAGKNEIRDIWGQVHKEEVPYNVATEMMETLLGAVTSSYVGCLMSGMVGGSPPPRAYREDYERNFYKAVIDWARSHFMDYFKPVSQR